MGRKGRLIQDADGLLSIWEHPIEGEDYVVGIDSSEGVRGGDLAAACVLKASSRALVAQAHGLVEPNHWGRLCCRIGWHYNEALLAFETAPSAHGHSAAREAMRQGYVRLYTRVSQTKAVPELTDKLGWQTMKQEKERMVDAIREALDEGWAMPSKALLRELQHLKYDDKGKIVTAASEHDDLFDAEAIALCVIEEAFMRGEIRTHKPKATCIEDEMVEEWENRSGPDANPNPQLERLYDGI